jgi:hypothetical protein
MSAPSPSFETEFAALARPGAPVASRARTAEKIRRFIEMATRHSVLPIVTRNLGQPASPELVAASGFTMLLRLRLDEIVRTFREHGIPFVVLKGAEFADRLYPDPALRGFTDIDLMVPRSALEQAGEALRSLHFHRHLPKGLRHAEQPYGEQVWISEGAGRVSVEIHWNLVNSPTIQRGVSVVFEDLPRDKDGRLTSAALLLIAAVHAAASHQFDRLGLLVDIRQAAMLPVPGPERSALVETAIRTGARLPLILALSLAHKFWGDAECAAWLDLFSKKLLDFVAGRTITTGLILRPICANTLQRRCLLRQLMKHSR